MQSMAPILLGAGAVVFLLGLALAAVVLYAIGGHRWLFEKARIK